MSRINYLPTYSGQKSLEHATTPTLKANALIAQHRPMQPNQGTDVHRDVAQEELNQMLLGAFISTMGGAVALTGIGSGNGPALLAGGGGMVVGVTTTMEAHLRAAKRRQAQREAQRQRATQNLHERQRQLQRP